MLRCSTHNGFPVFASNEEGVTDRRVTGLVLRSQLLVLLRRGHLQNASGELIKRASFVFAILLHSPSPQPGTCCNGLSSVFADQVDDIEKENIAINNEMRHFYNHGNSRNLDPIKMETFAAEIISGTNDATDVR